MKRITRNGQKNTKEHNDKIRKALIKYRAEFGNPNSPFVKGHKLGFKKGNTPWCKGIKGIIKRSDESKINYRNSKLGKNNPMFGKHPANWKGGTRKEYAIIRDSDCYKVWRRKVFERDNWTCVFCNKRGGDIETDHIKPFAYFPELRFEISNGRTLCKKCHQNTDTYTWKAQKLYAQSFGLSTDDIKFIKEW